jgi:Na+-driven multidrug efflux pump
MAVAGAVFFIWAEPLSQFFQGGRETDVSHIAAGLVRIVACAMPAFAVVSILGGGLRGAGDTRWPLLFTLIGFLALRIPLAYFLALDQVALPGVGVVFAAYGLGVYGAWYAMVADVVVRSLLTLARFLHGGWKNVPV